MNYIKIEKGKEAQILINDKELCGVYDLLCEQKYTRYDILEFLNEEPCDSVNQRSEYYITLLILSGFDSDELEAENFELELKSCGVIYKFSGCNVTDIKKSVPSDKYICDTYKIKAKALEKSQAAETEETQACQAQETQGEEAA